MDGSFPQRVSVVDVLIDVNAINNFKKDIIEYNFLVCNAVQFGKISPRFRRHVLPPSSMLKSNVSREPVAFLGSSVAYSSYIKLEEICSSEMSTNFKSS